MEPIRYLIPHRRSKACGVPRERSAPLPDVTLVGQGGEGLRGPALRNRGLQGGDLHHGPPWGRGEERSPRVRLFLLLGTGDGSWTAVEAGGRALAWSTSTSAAWARRKGTRHTGDTALSCPKQHWLLCREDPIEQCSVLVTKTFPNHRKQREFKGCGVVRLEVRSLLHAFGCSIALYSSLGNSLPKWHRNETQRCRS